MENGEYCEVPIEVNLKARLFLENECKKVVEKLKTMSFSQLLRLGNTMNTAIVHPNGQSASINVIVKHEFPNCLLVVVQCFMPMKGIMGWLKVKNVNVDGFRLYPDGRTEELDAKTIYEYD